MQCSCTMMTYTVTRTRRKFSRTPIPAAVLRANPRRIRGRCAAGPRPNTAGLCALHAAAQRAGCICEAVRDDALPRHAMCALRCGALCCGAVRCRVARWPSHRRMCTAQRGTAGMAALQPVPGTPDMVQRESASQSINSR